MMPVGPATRIYLAAGATDLRKSFEGLSDLVTHHFQADPLSGHLYVFTVSERSKPASGERMKTSHFEERVAWKGRSDN
jgi:transposase